VPDDNRVEPTFLVEALQTPVVREQIQGAATGTSGSMKNISQDAIRGLRIPLLTRHEQSRIASVLTESRAMQRLSESQALMLKRLRGTLLSDLLSGNHRIPDTYDRLLERAE
jgi:type I restriction enzyme S subunit